MAKQTRGKGEGNIRERKPGQWEARITLDNGQRKSIYGKTRKEVAARLAEALRDRDKGLPAVRDEQRTVAAFLASWLERVKPTIRPRTWIRYRQLLAHASRALGKVKLAKLTPVQVEHLYAKLLDGGLSTTTVHHLHTVLHHALSDALRKGDVQRNVCELIDAPRMRHHEMQVLSRDQARQLVAFVSGDRLEALYVLALSTGMRQGELLALKWRDIDLDDATLQVRGTMQRTPDGGLVIGEPKTKRSRRRITLTSVAVEALRRHRKRQAEERLSMGPAWDDQDLVFPNTIGRPMEGGHVLRRAFAPLLQRAGLPPIRFHDLRHTAATLMLLEGIHPKVVSEMLGHASIAITLDLYSHVLPNMQQDAARTLDRLFGAG